MEKKFKRALQINDCFIGPEAPVFIIAEAGVAHFGSLEKAFQLVDMAAQAGANAFKLQFFDVDELISIRANDWKDRLRPRNLTFDQVLQIKKRCDEYGLIFLSTAHDASRIAWLQELAVPAIKVGSGERGNVEFIKKLAQLKKPMIISTGMYTPTDIQLALDACASVDCFEVALLHCVTAYPTPANEVNLKAMDNLQNYFSGPVGYSDHTPSHLACLAAVARGAKIIERHITIDTNVPNAQDWKVSSTPENFVQLVRDIRAVESMLGDGIKKITPSEQASIYWATKSLVAAHDLPAGHLLNESDIAIKRPGDGISPTKYNELIGKKLRLAINKDALFKFEELL